MMCQWLEFHFISSDWLEKEPIKLKEGRVRLAVKYADTIKKLFLL